MMDIGIFPTEGELWGGGAVDWGKCVFDRETILFHLCNNTSFTHQLFYSCLGRYFTHS